MSEIVPGISPRCECGEEWCAGYLCPRCSSGMAECVDGGGDYCPTCGHGTGSPDREEP